MELMKAILGAGAPESAAGVQVLPERFAAVPEVRLVITSQVCLAKSRAGPEAPMERQKSDPREGESAPRGKGLVSLYLANSQLRAQRLHRAPHAAQRFSGQGSAPRPDSSAETFVLVDSGQNLPRDCV